MLVVRSSQQVGYIDDIIVYSDTWDAHRAHLRQLFQALRAANLQLHPGKRSFGAAAVRYLGHVVSREGINPCPSKVQAILEMLVPIAAKAVQRFLSKCQYYRKFIPNFSITAAPLFHAATRQKNFTWTPDADTAWRTLCKALSSEPVLTHPDCTRPFYLDCDGSGDDLGAVLLQPYDEGERVVPYASRSLLDHERKWTATELEAAALIWALETFRHYIDTVEVCIRAQQKHVDCLSRAPLPPTPKQRPLILDEFPARTVLHSRTAHPAPAGPSQLWCAPLCAAVNHVAHRAHRRVRLLRHRLCHLCAALRTSAPLSQRPTSGSEDEVDVQVRPTDSEDDSPPPSTAQPSSNAPTNLVHGGRNIPLPPAVEHFSLKDAQAQAPECQEFLRLARTPRVAWPPHLHHTPLQFCVLHDLVYIRTGDALPRVILATIFRRRVIQAQHLSYYGGHFGVSKTVARLSCSGTSAHTSAAALSASPTPNAPRKWRWLNLPIGTPFELIAIDLFGPLQPTRRGNIHVLVNHRSPYALGGARSSPQADSPGDDLGAVLLQPYDEGERVVSYASRSLLDHARKWTATELEAAALIWASETFRQYIDTVEVCIRTDHALYGNLMTMVQ
ncbi:hypothetical protein Emag_000298 [Eimeria magna]